MKYMGSKARLSKEFSKLFNELIEKNNINHYIEPFVGGCNLIEHIKCENRVGNDSNVFLVEMWKSLLIGWEFPREISREFYYQIKENKNLYPKELVAIVGFCSSYNAKFFGGYAGKVKIKNGKVRDYYDESIRNIEKQVPKLRGVKFESKSYDELDIPKNSFVYCDPPYLGTTGYNDTETFDHGSFFTWVRKKSIDNLIVVSEYNAPSDFICIFEKKLTTTMDKNSRKKDTEKLFVTKETFERFFLNIDINNEDV